MENRTKKQYTVKWVYGSKGDRYGLLCCKKSMIAVDCSCGDRIHRGRKAGRACKHMIAHNNAINEQARAARTAQNASESAKFAPVASGTQHSTPVSVLAIPACSPVQAIEQKWQLPAWMTGNGRVQLSGRAA